MEQYCVKRLLQPSTVYNKTAQNVGTNRVFYSVLMLMSLYRNMIEPRTWSFMLSSDRNLVPKFMKAAPS